MTKIAAASLSMILLAGCGQLKEKADAVEDVAAEVEAKAPDVKQYAKDLEDTIRDLDVEFVMQTVRYDPATKTFKNRTPPPTERNLFSVTEIGGKLYVLGGIDADGNYVDTLERYDPALDTWSSCASWPRPGFAYIEQVGDWLCALGGYKSLDEPIRREVDCYDPETDEWMSGSPVPASYSSFAPVVQDGKVYLLGGTGASLGVLDTALVYDPVKDEWEELAPLPEARGLMGAASVEGQIYLTGGFGEDSFDRDAESRLQDRNMLVYDPAEDSWSRAPDMPHARALYGIDSIEGRLAVFFGLTDGPLVELYDPSKDNWVGGEDPPTLPDGGVYTYVKHHEQMYLFVIADQISISKIGASGSLWRYDASANRWAEVAQRGADERDALFVGDSVGNEIYWVGAETVILY